MFARLYGCSTPNCVSGPTQSVNPERIARLVSRHRRAAQHVLIFIVRKYHRALRLICGSKSNGRCESCFCRKLRQMPQKVVSDAALLCALCDLCGSKCLRTIHRKGREEKNRRFESLADRSPPRQQPVTSGAKGTLAAYRSPPFSTTASSTSRMGMLSRTG